MDELIIEVKAEMNRGEITRANAFIDLILSNGDVLELLAEQLDAEGTPLLSGDNGDN